MAEIAEIKRKPNKEAIDLLMDIIKKIEQCEITGISIVSENSDGTFTFDGSQTISRYQTVGILMDLVLQRLK